MESQEDLATSWPAWEKNLSFYKFGAPARIPTVRQKVGVDCRPLHPRIRLAGGTLHLARQSVSLAEVIKEWRP